MAAISQRFARGKWLDSCTKGLFLECVSIFQVFAWAVCCCRHFFLQGALTTIFCILGERLSEQSARVKWPCLATCEFVSNGFGLRVVVRFPPSSFIRKQGIRHRTCEVC